MRIHRHSENRRQRLPPYLLDASVMAALVVILALSWNGLPQTPALAPGAAAERALARQLQLPDAAFDAGPGHLAEAAAEVTGAVRSQVAMTPGGR